MRWVLTARLIRRSGVRLLTMFRFLGTATPHVLGTPGALALVSTAFQIPPLIIAWLW